MKLKIRKVEVTPTEFFNRLTQIITTHEKMPAEFYLGTSLSYICKTMGIKELEFWQLKFENEKDFNEKFVIKEIGKGSGMFGLFRKEVWDKNTDT